MKRKKKYKEYYMYKLYYLNLRLLNVLGIWFLKICYGKFSFVNYLVNNRTPGKYKNKERHQSDKVLP